jgi:transposase
MAAEPLSMRKIREILRQKWELGRSHREVARAAPGGSRPRPDCSYLHTERRKPGVTLELLHLEYLEQHPDGYSYTQFCEIYRHSVAETYDAGQ